MPWPAHHNPAGTLISNLAPFPSSLTSLRYRDICYTEDLCYQIETKSSVISNTMFKDPLFHGLGHPHSIVLYHKNAVLTLLMEGDPDLSNRPPMAFSGSLCSHRAQDSPPVRCQSPNLGVG